MADDVGPPSGPGRDQLLVAGVAVVAYTFDQQEKPTADGATALASYDVAVAALLDQRPGWWLTSDDEALIEALLAAGAGLVRHSHLYSRPLTPSDADTDTSAAAAGTGGPGAPLPAGLRWTPVDRSPQELATLVVQAYPPGHLDHQGVDPEMEEPELVALLAGELVGPFLAGASGLIVDGDRVVAGVIINRSPGPPPTGGPWVSQVFRHPDPVYAGLGAAALGRSIAVLAATGEPALGLAVTDGNPARRVYERLGFHHLASRRKLVLPS